MSETQELKDNADKSRALSQMKDIEKYLDELSDRCLDALHWMVRGDMLVMISFLGFIVMVGLETWLETDKVLRELFSNIYFFITITTIFRSWTLDKEFAKATSEWAGAIHILRLLGMMPPKSGNRERKKQEVWSEGVAMVKSWFTQKKEAQEKVYAPA